MALKKMVDFHQNPTTNTEEIRFRVDNNEDIVPLPERIFDRSTLRIYSGPNQTGSLLTEGVDYIIGGINEYAGYRLGFTVHTRIKIQNENYIGVDLYIPQNSISMFGDVVAASDVNHLQAQIKAVTLNQIGKNIGDVFWSINPVPDFGALEAGHAPVHKEDYSELYELFLLIGGDIIAKRIMDEYSIDPYTAHEGSGSYATESIDNGGNFFLPIWPSPEQFVELGIVSTVKEGAYTLRSIVGDSENLSIVTRHNNTTGESDLSANLHLYIQAKRYNLAGDPVDRDMIQEPILFPIDLRNGDVTIDVPSPETRAYKVRYFVLRDSDENLVKFRFQKGTHRIPTRYNRREEVSFDVFEDHYSLTLMKEGEFAEFIPIGDAGSRRWYVYDFDTIRFHEHIRKSSIDTGNSFPSRNPYDNVGVLFNYTGSEHGGPGLYKRINIPVAECSVVEMTFPINNKSWKLVMRNTGELNGIERGKRFPVVGNQFDRLFYYTGDDYAGSGVYRRVNSSANVSERRYSVGTEVWELKYSENSDVSSFQWSDSFPVIGVKNGDYHFYTGSGYGGSGLYRKEAKTTGVINNEGEYQVGSFIWKLIQSEQINVLGTENLDTILRPGNFFQDDLASVTTARNYPIAGKRTLINVSQFGSGNNLRLKQEATVIITTQDEDVVIRKLLRHRVAGTFSPWSESIVTREGITTEVRKTNPSNRRVPTEKAISDRINSDFDNHNNLVNVETKSTTTNGLNIIHEITYNEYGHIVDIKTRNLNLVTSSADGIMRKADKALLDTKTNLPTADAMVRRDSAGRARFESPSDIKDAANKKYVDDEIVDGFTEHNKTGATDSEVSVGANGDNGGRQILSSIKTNEYGHVLGVVKRQLNNVTENHDGIMRKADKALLDTKTNLPTADAMVRRDSAGRARFEAPGVDKDAANKKYVDDADSDLDGRINDITHSGNVKIPISKPANVTNGSIWIE